MWESRLHGGIAIAPARVTRIAALPQLSRRGRPRPTPRPLIMAHPLRGVSASGRIESGWPASRFMTFKDLFSTQSADYARFRPHYPQALFSWLASVAPGRACAVDVATGNGQAALALADEFTQVVAVDASAAQLAEAPAHPRVVYRVGQAEATGVADASADLLTAAQAF